MSTENRIAALEARLKTVEDIWAIQELAGQYINGSDGGWDRKGHDSSKVAPLFTEDGTWNCENLVSAAGEKELYGLWDKFRQNTPFGYHWLTNPLIEVSGDTAYGEWHRLAFVTSRLAPGTDSKEVVEKFTAGVFFTDFARTPKGWRIKKMFIRNAFFEPFAKGWVDAKLAK